MGEARTDKAMVEPKSLASQVMLNLVYVSIWIGLSGTVILYNKWILAYYGFPYPIALTIWHMTFSSALAFAVVRLGYVEACNMSAETYVKAVVPIGACFAGTLWLGNAAYLYLSVSFIQMLKVRLPLICPGRLHSRHLGFGGCCVHAYAFRFLGLMYVDANLFYLLQAQAQTFAGHVALKRIACCLAVSVMSHSGVM